MTTVRDTFHSRIGFVLAAAGSAVGLGNIWGFPTQAANNGGGAFLFVYLIVTILLGLPALYAEIYLGNQTQKNPVSALTQACTPKAPNLGKTVGIIGLFGALIMLSFYTIVAGWMLAHALSALTELLGWLNISTWLITDSTARNLLFTPLFIVLGALIIYQGVNKGIEKWSTRLMPSLILMMISLIIYILNQPGAINGLAVYLIPDFSQVANPKLIISAMGQAFFSLSLGVGGMMIYGSYMKKGKDIGRLVLSITALDTAIAFMAGLLIIPALYAAQYAGQEVFENSQLIGEGQLIFAILPSLFNSMGTIGLIVAFAFFSLLSIAALTSTISSTEVLVAYVVEEKSFSRHKSTWLISLNILLMSTFIIVFFDVLFPLAIRVLTTIIQPLGCLFYFIIIGWLWQRGNKFSNKSFTSISKKHQYLSVYLKYICPILLLVVFINVAILN